MDQIPGEDPTIANVARIYDYFLCGKDNFAVDREAGDRILESAPEVRSALLANRSFLRRVVTFLAGEVGIDQFIDLGAGLPTQENVHEVAQRVNPQARVAYVDYDPVVLAHARALLAVNDRTTVIQADVRRPADVLTHPAIRHLLDMSKPTAVLMMAILHFVGEDEDAASIIAGYREAMAPGSFLALSLGTTDGVDPQKIARAQETYRNATSQLTYRSRQQIDELFDGFELVQPGLVRLQEWRPLPAYAHADSPGAEWMLGGVGRLLP
jgi:O-methyltransferase involved in polyketide biosynthesis